jgi:hypothetical protein
MKKNVFHCEDCKIDFLDDKSLKKQQKRNETCLSRNSFQMDLDVKVVEEE